MIADAHHTSANYENGVSEFEKQTLKKNTKDIKFLLQRKPINYTAKFK
jgi:hypothetical protein